MKKIIISSIVIVAILPMLYFGGIIPLSSHSVSISPAMEYEELMEKSKIVASGKIIDSQVNVKFLDEEELLVSEITTAWTFKIKDLIKGQPSKEIEFVTEGGKYNNMVHTVIDGIELEVGDKLIIFLDKTPSSIWGDNYYLTGMKSGVYKIENDNNAKNEFLKKSFVESDFKQKLKEHKDANR